MPDTLLSWRERFPILATKNYLINNSLGAMPGSVPASLAEYTDLWATEGVVAWDRWLPEVANVSGILEDIVHAPRGSMTMCQNVTNALAMVLSCFDWQATKRNRIIHAAAEFPTVEYLLDGQRKYGAEVVRVGGSDPLEFPAEPLIAAIDDQTALVVVSHVLFRTSELVDIRPIVERAHRHGALVVLDAYQSMGAVPFDVTALDIDILAGGSVKWLCGGPGAGYLYVAPRLVGDLEPGFAGWFSHEAPFAFAAPPIDFAAGIARFTGGTPNMPAYYQAREGYRIIREVGTAAIREKSQRQSQRLFDGARQRGWRVNSPEDPARRGGHVTIDIPEGARVKDALIARGIVVDFRPGAGIRIAPHFYNSDEECDAALEAVAELTTTAR